MIEILKTLPLNSVQDLGRPGKRGLGIARAGALDTLAMMGANALLGNAPQEAVLEIQMFPVSMRFTQRTLIALTGADSRAEINGKRLPPWWVREVHPGDELHMLPPLRGARCYLAVQGGIDVPEVLGSRSTALRYGFGGHRGRSLQKGDVLPVGAGSASCRSSAGFGARAPADVLKSAPDGAAGDTPNDKDICLRVMRAAEYDLFDEASQTAFENATWTVSTQSDRMGYRLSGPALQRKVHGEMRSHPIVPGVVQVPPSGQPIVQLADGNSAGGYPKIGFIIDADLWRIAQARPGARLRFRMCGIAEARRAQAEVEDYLTGLREQARYGRVPAGSQRMR